MLRAICGIRCLRGRAPRTVYQRYRKNCISTSSSCLEILRSTKITDPVLRSVTELDPRHDNNRESDADFLARAQQYEISTIKQLDRVCLSFLNKKNNSDQSEIRQFHSDLEFWKLLLDYGIRTHGIVGARSVWQGLKYSARVKLDSDDDLTTSIWLKLLHVVVQTEDLALLDLLFERNGIAWKRPKLLTEAVVSLLRQGLEIDAVLMCYRLREKCTDQEYDMLDLFMAYQPRGPNEFRRFFLVYDHLNPGKMYVKAINYLWQEGRSDDAFILHKFLISKGDFPSSFLDLEPFLVNLASTNQDPAPFIRQLTAAGAGYAVQARTAYELEQKRQNVVEGGVVGFELYTSKRTSNSVSDSVAAKAFAARALSFEFVLNSLRAFGLTEIGPQSIREIGIAAGDLDTFARRLAILDHHEVDTGGSAYSRIVRKLCTAKEHTLLQQVLKTDMHHDVFEDVMLQRRLLADKVLKCKWSEVNLLLTMLNHGDVGILKSHVTVALLAPLSTDRLAQRVFLGACKQNPTFSKVEDPLSHVFIVEGLIRELCTVQYRRWSRQQRLDRIRFIVGYMQDCVATGTTFHYFHWRHILLQLGANHSLEEVYSLILWISNQVASGRGKPTIVSSHDPPAQILNTLFDFQFQAALMHWSLRSLFLITSQKANQDWRKSLYLLKTLEDRYRVNVNLPTLRRIAVLRCSHLRRSGVASRAGTQIFSSMAQARRTCSEILKWTHELWSTSPTMRQEELRIAFRLLKARKNWRHSSSFRFTRFKRLQKFSRSWKEQSISTREKQ